MTFASIRTAPASAGVFVCARRALATGALALLLAACAAPPQTAALREARSAPALASALAVPFIAQEAYQCGPAALAMVLQASGLSVDAEALVPQVYLPARQGSLQPEMLATARRHGRLAVVLPPRLPALLAELAAGTPVVVLQNLSLPIAPRWHYAVAIGFDPAREELILHSGTTPQQRLPLPVFERTWARGGHWAMVAVAPERPPASVDADALAAAAAALERVDVAAAQRSYAAIAARAPDAFGAWLGLGNTALQRRDLPAAVRAFERATALRPDSADAWNNFALALLHAGRPQPALTAARRAVDLGGARLERYRKTLAAAEAAAAAAPR